MFCKYMVARALLLFRRTIAVMRRAKETVKRAPPRSSARLGLASSTKRCRWSRLRRHGGRGDPGNGGREIFRRAAVQPAIPDCCRLSQHPHDLLLAAIDLLKATDESDARVLPNRLPSAFLAPK